jgi:predicted DNA-binding transcriptional regulator AlpA
MDANPAALPATLTMDQIRQFYLPLGKRTLFRMISAGQFPPAEIAIGGKIRLWKRESIEQWLDDQVARGSRRR